MQALRKDPITVYGDGSQTRSFCYVSDLVRGLFKMMNQEKTLGPVNLGNPGEYSMKELAEKVREEIGGDSQIEWRTLPQDDP